MLVVGAGREERVPGARVDGGQAEQVGCLGERDGAEVECGQPLDLGDREVDVPQRHDAHGDEAPVGAGAPLLDDEVVVGPDAGQGQVLVLREGEGLPAEADEHVGVADRRLDARGVHVGQPGGRVVEALAHVVVGDRAGVDLRRGTPAAAAMRTSGTRLPS